MAVFDATDENPQDLNPKVGEYWKVRIGSNDLYAIISNESPLEVKYFAPTAKSQGNLHYLNEDPFDVCFEDLQGKIDPPKIIEKGKFRKFYQFIQP